MRQTFKYFLWATVLVALLISCNKEEDEIVVADGDEMKLDDFELD